MKTNNKRLMLSRSTLRTLSADGLETAQGRGYVFYNPPPILNSIPVNQTLGTNSDRMESLCKGCATVTCITIC